MISSFCFVHPSAIVDLFLACVLLTLSGTEAFLECRLLTTPLEVLVVSVSGPAPLDTVGIDCWLFEDAIQLSSGSGFSTDFDG